ncbi:MAG: hypothetical protein ACMXX8_00900 [Candidatus Woesearchaeota archaeon]
MVNKKRGGITVYIIIAVVVFLISSLVFTFLRSGSDFGKDIIPVEIRDHAVIYFIDECIKDTTFNGIKQISLYSGNLNTVPDSTNPMQSSGVYYTDVFIPYWYYIENGQFKSNKVPLHKDEGDNSIEEQLTNYITNNLHSCLNNFENFKNQYVVEEGDLNVEVLIRQNDILVNVLYPIRIISLSDDSIRTENNFNTRLDIAYKELYEFAEKISEKQLDMNFIEQSILNVISLYSGLDEPLPPMSDVTIGSNDLRYWTRSRVEQTIKNDVLEFVRLIQILNAGNFNPIVYDEYSGVNEIMQGIYASFTYKVGDKLYPNIDVDFLYPSTDIYLNIGNQELIMPENRIPLRNFITDMLRIIIYDYSFEYDLSFPVVTTLKLNDVYKNEDLYLRFGIQANIRNNIPLNVEFDEGFKDIDFKPSYGYEDEETFSYDPVLVYTFDSVTGMLIDDVEIFYSCGRETFIEKTYFGYVFEYFPFCMFGGRIIARHEDYATKVVAFDNHDEIDKELILEMYPLKEIEVEVRKIEFEKIDLFTQPLSPLYSRADLIYEYSTPLKENERVLLTLNKIKEFNEEEDIPFMGFLELSQSDFVHNLDFIKNQIEELYESGNITLQERDEMLVQLRDAPIDYIEMDNKFSLVPGNYSFNAYLFYDGNITIPEKITSFCPSLDPLGFCLTSEETIELPEMNFETFPTGEALANITISYDLYNSSKIIFYVFADKVPQTWDEFEEMKDVEDYYEYNYLLKPYLK